MQDTVIRKYKIELDAGIHVRTAMTIMKLAEKFKSGIQIEKDGRSVDVSSPLGILTLGIAAGDEMTVKISGEDSLALAEAFDKLVESNFGE